MVIQWVRLGDVRPHFYCRRGVFLPAFFNEI
jgi:hypothetical protein